MLTIEECQKKVEKNNPGFDVRLAKNDNRFALFVVTKGRIPASSKARVNRQTGKTDYFGIGELNSDIMTGLSYEEIAKDRI